MDAQVGAWDSAGAERAIAVLKAVADPTRYRLLWALSRQEFPVGSLAEMAGAHVAAISQHLAKLRAAGLVVSRREGTRIYYRAAGPHVRGLLEEAALVASAPSGGGATGDADEAVEAAAAEQPIRAVRPVRARRPVTEQ
ncbi:metalloregulator ArsR/SmtB family transcription factor [Streptomyces yunnanensis]|uniref:Metalloregulator ArsR/SmtB family transcription factor n=1 Tax=Streptomyces yunnanensis TaxID=156453 RepID=A0ABY8AJX6_9ACTN|nr:metalloregulator ArsR/SmtB family transcription factor [Streptomyces yunnanensis]WEB45268.1 metalloregulator ArsR/SmtB family transcription factor [Streptomyces yunnanensis]